MSGLERAALGPAVGISEPTSEPTPDQLVALTTWAALHGMDPDEVRRLRLKGRIAPVYHHFTHGQRYYFLTRDARVFTTSQGAESRALEGYMALHDLEAAHGPLRRAVVTRLSESGRICPVGHVPLLLTLADARLVLKALERASEPAPLEAWTHPSWLLPPGRTFQERPSPQTFQEALEPERLSLEQSAPGLPFVSQRAWVQIPRFEARSNPSGVLVLDRGEAAEHLYSPRPKAHFYDLILAEQVFPVWDLRPIPPSSEPGDQSPDSTLPLDPSPPDEDTARADISDSAQPTEEDQADLQTELAEVKSQLLEAQGALERALAKKPGTGRARMPERRVLQLEEALAEREALQLQVQRLETEQARLLSDQARLRERASRVSHLGHVGERLLERFGLELSEKQIEALDRQTRTLPSVGYTLQDKPFKLLQLGDHSVYALIGRDEQGEECMVTVYDEAMFRKAQERRSRKR